MKKVLKLVVLVGIFSMLLPISVLADDKEPEVKNRDELAAWMDSHVGQEYDFDGENGAQCVELITQQSFLIGHYLGKGGKLAFDTAIAYKTVNIPKEYERVIGKGLDGAQVGDIVVINPYTHGTEGAGHIGILCEKTDTKFKMWEQNVDNTPLQGGPIRKAKIEYDIATGVACYIIPPYKDKKAFSGAKPPEKKETDGEEVDVSNFADSKNAMRTRKIVNDNLGVKNGKQIEDIGNIRTLTIVTWVTDLVWGIYGIGLVIWCLYVAVGLMFLYVLGGDGKSIEKGGGYHTAMVGFGGEFADKWYKKIWGNSTVTKYLNKYNYICLV